MKRLSQEEKYSPKTEQLDPVKYFEKNIEQAAVNKELITDPDVARILAESIVSLRNRSQELLDAAKSLAAEDDPEAWIRTHEALELEHRARGHEENMAYYAKRLAELEPDSPEAKRELRSLRIAACESYLSSAVSVAGSKYRSLRESFGLYPVPIKNSNRNFKIPKIKG